MKFEIPEIFQTIKLSDYAPEFGDASIQVRVNPPKGWLKEIGSFPIQKGEITNKTIDKFSGMIGELWGWTKDEVTSLFEHSQDTDPKLFEWLVTKTLTLIISHRNHVKKN